LKIPLNGEDWRPQIDTNCSAAWPKNCEYGALT
jgi:hypothetical protein